MLASIGVFRAYALKVLAGFKNLVDVDVHFGPFTCIAGANGVGKSNLFDAINFGNFLRTTSSLTQRCQFATKEIEQAMFQACFIASAIGDDERMDFERKMIVPAEGNDDLGQLAKASMTFLRYQLSLGYRKGDPASSMGGIEILKEDLLG